MGGVGMGDCVLFGVGGGVGGCEGDVGERVGGGLVGASVDVGASVGGGTTARNSMEGPDSSATPPGDAPMSCATLRSRVRCARTRRTSGAVTHSAMTAVLRPTGNRRVTLMRGGCMVAFV